MCANGYFLSNFEIEILFKRMDKNSNERISFSEFINELNPKLHI